MNRTCTQDRRTVTGQTLLTRPLAPPRPTGGPGALLLSLDPVQPGRILCETCPAERACRREPMSYPLMDSAVRQARGMGFDRFLLLSRRPSAYAAEAVDLALKHPECLFLLLGAAAIPEEGFAAQLAGVENLLLAVNATDLICAGVDQGYSGASRLTEQTFELLQAEGVRCGFSCCCTRADLERAFRAPPVEQLAGLGALFGMYFPYMPRSWNSPAPQVPNREQWRAAGREIRELERRVSIPLFDCSADFSFLDHGAEDGGQPGSTLVHAVDSRLRFLTLEESLELAEQPLGPAAQPPALPAEAAEMSPEQRLICPLLADPAYQRRTMYVNL